MIWMYLVMTILTLLSAIVYGYFAVVGSWMFWIPACLFLACFVCGMILFIEMRRLKDE